MNTHQQTLTKKSVRAYMQTCAHINIHINTFPHILSLTQALATALAAEQQVAANAVAATTAADEIAKASEVAAAAAIIAAHQQSIVDNATALAIDIAAETQVLVAPAHNCTHTHKSTHMHTRAHVGTKEHTL